MWKWKMSWWQLQKKRQQEYDDELARRAALELQEQRERAEKLALIAQERDEVAEEREQLGTQNLREEAEWQMTRAKGRSNWLTNLLKSRKQRKEKSRELAEKMIAGREARPSVPKAETQNVTGPSLRLRKN